MIIITILIVVHITILIFMMIILRASTVELSHHDHHHHPHHDDNSQGEYSGALPDADGLCGRSVTACGKPDLMQYQVWDHHHDHDDHNERFCHFPFIVVVQSATSCRRGEQAASNFLIHFLQLVQFSPRSAHSSPVLASLKYAQVFAQVALLYKCGWGSFKTPNLCPSTSVPWLFPRRIVR